MSTSDPYDQEILNMAIDLCRRLRLSKRYDPQTLGWSEKVSWDYCFFSPGVRKRTKLILPLTLRTKLEPAQWKPLLAYSLIQVRYRTRDFLIPFWLFVIPLSAFFLASAYISLTFGMIFFLPFGITPIFLLALLLSLHQAKKNLLRRVRETAEFVGGDATLATFQKVDSLGLSEVQKGKERKGLIGKLWPIPSIVERIEYLRTLE